MSSKTIISRFLALCMLGFLTSGCLVEPNLKQEFQR